MFGKKQIAKIAGDFSLNIVASLVYNFARQIVIFPLLAARLPEADYGILLTVVGLVNVANALVGNVLNNVRLVQAERYEEKGYKGDFLFLCTIGSLLSVVFVGVLGAVFGLPWITTALLGIYTCVNIFYQYAIVYFRLVLNFKRSLIVNCLISAVSIVLAIFFATSVLWPVVFLLGDAVGLLYTIFTTRFYRETFQRTPLFQETTKKYVALALSSVLANLLLYADRFIIYPLLGSESVSYYSTASFFGKSAGMVITPITGVLLGYFSQKGFKSSKKLFGVINGISLACLAVFMVGGLLFAPWFTRVLYPSLYEQSAPYIVLANLGAVISIAGNMAQPMILKFCSMKLLLVTQVLYGAAYVIAAVVLLPSYGLLGFCYATILANTVRLLLLYLIGLIKL